ncbi:FAD-binding oxidoreductase [Erythrobacter sp. HL-111]|uniref:NAD(P)/FAD-dependent oxidoreductase n=1 Tax=Erythrobacter sp. HL-111 TaxID=1798193 RepID=UPI0006DB3E9C|nr:FAD-binding oxidoreductase [Erythrobacter sp. HL-111]KPP89759.1 MAG: Glycine/D-amino acid oxidases (deaminating) [Erythrobacteraceae bacterium HL-111]SDT11084.1 Glycine/D-amino acid oxidase [Erythrobacter sp. HL-111]
MTGTTYDFAVIGAGMAGASLAAELGPHARVLLLEAEDAPGYHSTGRSAAFWEQCYGGPGVVPLTLPSGRYLREHGFLKDRGALYVGKAGDGETMDAFMASFAGTGVTIGRLGRAGLVERVPLMREEWVDAIWEPACADIDVAGLHQHYLKALREAGVELAVRARVASLAPENGGWRIACEDGRSFRAARVVNAAGAWADTIARLAGARPLGIDPKRRTVVQLRVSPTAPDDLPLVLDINGRFYFKPDNGRLWLSPHDEVPSEPCDAAPEEIDVARAIDRFEAVTNWRIEALEHRWAGLRSFAPDRLPVYGPDPRVAGFFWFAGQGGFGIQTAPAAARLGAQLLLGQEADTMTAGIDPAAYGPARFDTEKTARTG